MNIQYCSYPTGMAPIGMIGNAVLVTCNLLTVLHLYNLISISGETDWKILAIDVTDPIANKLEGIAQCLICQYSTFCYNKYNAIDVF